MRKKLNIVFALHNPGVFRSFEKTIQYLCCQDHKVTVLYGDFGKEIIVNRGLKNNLDAVPNLYAEPIRFRKKFKGFTNIREIVNCANYYRKNHPTPWEAKRWLRSVSKPIRKRIKRSALVRQILSFKSARNLLKATERLLPVDKQIETWLKNATPDILIASPYIIRSAPEVEYIKAAIKLGVPSAVAVLSWDNLTTKGTFPIYPDFVLVWNEKIAQEAIDLHDVQPNKILVTGAPVFDFWFDMNPSKDYADFCRCCGLETSKPYILYLCSSSYIAADEKIFINELFQTIKKSRYNDRFQLLVRPHPLNAQIWDRTNNQELCVWPRDSQWTDLDDVKQDYFNSIFHSSAVMGINTSAFLESAILDKPCLTLMDERYKSKQTGLGHFRHLLDGNFIEMTHSHDQTIQRIIEILNGQDNKKNNRNAFIKNFIRPAGIAKPASEVMGEAIINAARINARTG